VLDRVNEPDGTFRFLGFVVRCGSWCLVFIYAGYRGFWLNCGLRHLLHLQVSRRISVLNRQSLSRRIPSKINNRSADPGLLEPERRNTMVYAWWMACLADAFGSAYFRRKPMLCASRVLSLF
jgi:hypothetical protein